MNKTILKEISILDIPDFHIGNALDPQHATGVTVIIPDGGATTGIDIRGGGPASREAGLLNPLAANDSANAVVLSGGSAFGLDSASGVMKYLEEKNIGFATNEGVVPIVVTSCIYDLELVSASVRPDAQMGYQACLNSETNNYQDGNYGCGCGATAGKLLGTDHMMKTGIGSAAYQLGDLMVGAIVSVNCAGDVYDFTTAKKIAGCIDYDTKQFISSEEMLYTMQLKLANTNTTIGAILTNARFNKTELTKIAGMAHDGMARSINPIHTQFDGDSIYAISNGDVVSDINIVGTLAARAFSAAITNAVKHAKAEYDLLAYESLQ